MLGTIYAAILTCVTRPPVSAEADKRYVRQQFVDLAFLCGTKNKNLAAVRDEFLAGTRSQPTYVFDDGAEFVASDYFEMEVNRSSFDARLRSKAEELHFALDDLDTIWSSYLSGAWGICLIHVSPETIVEKDHLVNRIVALIERPNEDDVSWRSALLQCVDRLDELERPFCAHDRAFFGAVSRDVFITAVRQKYALAFLRPST